MSTKSTRVIQNKPTAIRLKELQPILQKEAFRQDRSLNWLIVKILKEYVILNNLK